MNVKHFLLLFVFCFSIAGHSQNVSLELVYLQTDKGIYETGEDLWFKTYTLDAQSLALSDRSKTLFVEMLNAKDSIVWQEKYPHPFRHCRGARLCGQGLEGGRLPHPCLYPLFFSE